METQEMEVEGYGGSKGEEGGRGTQQALEALEFLTQDSEPSGTTLVDSRYGFNDMSRLAMLWTVQRRWPSRACGGGERSQGHKGGGEREIRRGWKRGMERGERGERRNIGHVDTEEEEGDHAPLTALSWGTQESGE